MRFGTWNVRRLRWSGSLTAAARELARYKLDFLGVREVRWDKGGTVRAGFFFFLWKRNKNRQLRTGIFVHHRRVPAVKRLEDFSDGIHSSEMSLCNIVLNVRAVTEEKSDDSGDNFYEELEQVFDHIPKYHIKILVGEFNTKVGGENVLKPTIGKESTPPQKICLLRARCSHTETYISTPGPFLRRRLTTRLTTYW